MSLLHELGDEDLFLIVLGGLVPEVLTRDEERIVPAHLGTTDVDVLLTTQVEVDADLARVESALERLEFEPDPAEDGWRWRGRIDGAPVVIEFLCDLDEHREGESIHPPGCRRLAALNLRGTGYVAKDFEWNELTAELPDGSEARVRVRYAGLEGYLLSKCVTARTRGAVKDYYDFAYVLLHNRAGGPEEAAQRLLAGGFAGKLNALTSTFREVRERFVRTSDVGPRSYAEQALQVEPDADAALLRADAVDAVQRFFTALGL